MRKGLERQKKILKPQLPLPTLTTAESPDVGKMNPGSDRSFQYSQILSPKSQFEISNISSQGFRSPKIPVRASPLSERRPESGSRIFEFSSEAPRIKQLESALERAKRTYEGQLSYMQEYINILKRKLGMNKGDDDDLSKYTENSSFIKSLQEKVEELSMSLAGKDREIENLSEELCEKQGHIEQLTKKIMVIERGEEIIKNKHTLSSETTVSIEREMKMFYEKQVQELENECMSLRMENKNKLRQIHYLDNEAKAHEAQLIQKSMKTLESKLSEQVNNHLNSLERELKALTEKAESYETKITFLTKNLRFLQSSSIESRQLQNTHKELKEELQIKTDVIENLEKDLKKLSLEIAEATTRNIEYESERNEWEKHADESEKERRRINEVYEESGREVERLKRKVEEGERGRKVIEEIVEEKNREMIKVQEEVDEVRRALDERDRQLLKRDKAIEEVLESKTSLEVESSKIIQEAERKLAEKSLKIRELQENIEMKLKEVVTMQEIINQNYVQIDRLDSIKSEREEELSNNQADFKALHLQLISHLDRIRSLEFNRSEASIKLETLLDDLKIPKKVIQDKENQIRKPEAVIESKPSSIENLMSVYKNHLEKSDESIKDLTETQETKKKIEECLNLAIISVENLTNSMQNETNRYETSIKELAADKSELRANFQHLQAEKEKEKHIFHEILQEKERICSSLLTELEQIRSELDDHTIFSKEFKLKHVESETNQARLVLSLNEVISSQKSVESKLRKEIIEINRQNSELKQKLSRIDHEITKVSDENSDLRQKLEEVFANSSVSRDKQSKSIFELENRIRELEGDKRSMEREAENSRNETEAANRRGKVQESELNSRITDLENEIKLMEEENIKKIAVVNQKELEVYNQKGVFLSKINLLNEKIREKDCELLVKSEEAKEFINKISRITEECDKFKKLCNEFENSMLKSQEESLALQDFAQNLSQTESKHISLITAQESAISEYETLNKSLSSQLQSTRSEFTELKLSKDRETHEHSSILASKESEIQSYLHQINDLKNQLESLSNALKDSKQAALEAETSLSSTIKDLKSTIEQTKNKEKHLIKENFTLTNSNSELKQRLNSLDQELLKAAEENNGLKAKVEENETRYLEINFKQSSVIKQLEIEQKELYQQLQHSVQSAEKTKSDIENSTSSKKSQILALNKDLEAKEKSIEELKLEIQKEGIKRQSQKKKQADIEVHYKELIEALNKKFSDKELECAELMDSKLVIEGINKRLSESKFAHEEKINETLGIITELQSKLKCKDEELALLQESMRKLNHCLEDEANKSTIHLSTINQLQSEISDLKDANLILKQLNLSEKEKCEQDLSEVKVNFNLTLSGNQELNNHLEALKQELKILKLNSIESESNLSTLNATLAEELKSQKLSEFKLKKELNASREHSERLKLEISNLEIKSQKLYEESISIKNKLEDSRHKSALSHNQDQEIIAEQETSIRQLRKVNNELEVSLQRGEKRYKELLEGSEAAIQELKYQLKDMEKDLEAADREIISKASEAEMLKNAKSLLEDEKKELSFEVQVLKENSSRNKEAFDDHIEELENTIASCKSSIQYEVKLKEDLKVILEEHKEKLKEQEEIIIKLTEENEKSLQLISSLEAVIQKEQSDFENNLINKVSQLEDMEKRLSEHGYREESLLKEIASHKESQMNLNKEIFYLKDTLDSASFQIQSLEMTIKELSYQNQLDKQELSQTHSEVSSLIKEKVSLLLQIEDLKTKSLEQTNKFELQLQSLESKLASYPEVVIKQHIPYILKNNPSLLSDLPIENPNRKTSEKGQNVGDLNKFKIELEIIKYELEETEEKCRKFNKENKELRRQVEDTLGERKEREDQFNEIFAELERNQIERKQLEEEVMELRGSNERYSRRCIQDADRIKELEENGGKLQEKLKELDKRFNELMEINRNLRKDLSSRSAEMEEIKSALNSKLRESEINDLKYAQEVKQNSLLRTEENRLSEQAKILLSEVDTLRRLIEAEKQSSKHSEAIKESLQYKSVEQEKQISELEKKYRMLTEDHVELRGAFNKASSRLADSELVAAERHTEGISLKKELENMRISIQELTETNENLLSSFKSTENRLKESELWRNSLEEQIKNQHELIEQFESEKLSLQSQIEGYKSSIIKLRGRNLKRKNTITSMNSDIESLTSQLTMIERLSAENQTLKQNQSENQQEIESLSVKLSKVKAELKHQKANNKDLDKNFKNQTEELSEITQRLEKSLEEISNFEQDIKVKVIENDRLIKLVKEQESKLKKSKFKRHELKQKLTDVSAENETNSRSLSDLLKVSNELSEDLKTKQREIEAVVYQLDGEKSINSSLKEKLSTRDSKIHYIEAEIAKLEEINKETQENLHEVSEAYKSKYELTLELEDHLNKLNEELERTVYELQQSLEYNSELKFEIEKQDLLIIAAESENAANHAIFEGLFGKLQLVLELSTEKDKKIKGLIRNLENSHEEIDDYKQSCMEFEEKINSLVVDYENTLKQLEESNYNYLMLEEKNSAKDIQLAALEAECQINKNLLENLSQEVEELKQSNLEKHEKAVSLKAELDLAVKGLNDKSQLCKDFDKKLKMRISEHERSKHELKLAKDTIANLEEIVNKKHSIVEAIEGDNKNHVNLISSLSQELGELKENNFELLQKIDSLTFDLESALKSLADSSITYKEFEENIKAKDKENSLIMEELAKVEQEVNDLKELLNLKESLIKSHENELKKNKGLIDALSQEKEKFKAKNFELQQKSNSLSTDLNSNTNALNKIQQASKDFESKLASKVNECESIAKKLSLEKERVMNLESSIESQAELLKSNELEISRQTSMLENAMREAEKFRLLLDEHKEQIIEAENREKTLEQNLSESLIQAKKAQQANEKISELLEQEKQKNKVLEKKQLEAKANLSDISAKSLKSQSDKVLEIEKLNNINELLEQKANEFREKAVNLEKELNSLMQEHNKLKDDFNAQRASADRLGKDHQLQIKSTKNLKDKLDSAVRENENLLKLNETLKSNLDDEKKKSSLSDRKLLQLSKSTASEIEGLKRKIQETTLNLEQESHLKELLESDIEKLNSELEELKKITRKHEARNSYLEETKKTLEAEILSLNEENQSLLEGGESVNEEKEKHMSDLESLVAKLKEELLTLNKDMNTIQINNKKEKAKLEALVAEKEKKITAQSLKIQISLEESQTCKKIIESKNDEILAKRVEITKLQKELAETKSPRDPSSLLTDNLQLRTELQQKEGIIASLNSKLKELQESLEDHRKKSLGVEKELNAIMKKNERLEKELQGLKSSGGDLNQSFASEESIESIQKEHKMLQRTLTQLRSNKEREKTESNKVINEQTARIKGLVEELEILKQSLKEKELFFNRLKNLNLQTPEGLRKATEILTKA